MADMEKITINMNVVELGQVDLLVEQGFYSSRTDFIRAAIRTQLQSHGDAIKETTTRTVAALGAFYYNSDDLEQRRARGEKLNIVAVGLVAIGQGVTPELALATIQSIKVWGVLKIGDEVRKALGDRIRT